MNYQAIIKENGDKTILIFSYKLFFGLIEKRKTFADIKDNDYWLSFHFLGIKLSKYIIVIPDKYERPGWNIDIGKVYLKFFYKRMIYRDDNTEYLYRINFFECNLFSLKLHKILASDDQCQHDHPWSFISFILKNGYIEHTPNGGSRYKAGSIIYRPAKWIHSLELLPGKPATTFVITFARIRKWGFFTKTGEWIHWKLYKAKEHC